MATPRSPVFDNVDTALLGLLQQVAAAYQPYKVDITSGYRNGDPRFHGKGQALDVQMTDPKTGAALKNIGSGESAPAYQAFANELYRKASPELRKKLRWGGYFAGGKNPLDLMHFDLGGGEGGVSMGGGDWANGWTPAMMDTWKIASNVGLGAEAQQMKAAGYSDQQIKTALLNVIAGTESPGYDVLTGGGKFSGYGQHPNVHVPLDGPGGNYSTAAGRYQFIKPTWDRVAKQYGYKDFSPGNQDAAAWQLAAEQMGGEDKLMEALNSGDAGRLNAVASLLGSQWEGIKKLGTGTFAERFNKELGAPSGDGTTEVADDDGGYGARPTGDKSKPKSLWETLGEGLSAAGKSMGQPMKPPQYAQPQAARVDAPAGPPPAVAINPNRAQLAQVMLERLNSGRLF